MKRNITLEVVSVDTYFGMIDNGYVVNPPYQSGCRWNIKDRTAFVDDVAAGKAIPPIVFAVVEVEEGEPLRLRIDGNQRTFSLEEERRRIGDELAKEDLPEDARAALEKRAEAIGEAEVPILSYGLTADEAKDYFCRLNKGVKLSVSQSAKAFYSQPVQEALNEVVARMEAQKGPGVKWGKTVPDVAAPMILASAMVPGRSASSSEEAKKVLKKAVDVPPAAMEAVKAALATVARLAVMDKTTAAKIAAEEAAAARAAAEGQTYIPAPGAAYPACGPLAVYWASPKRLVPLTVTAGRVDAPEGESKPEALARVVAAYDVGSKEERTFVTPPRKEGGAVKTVRMAVNEVWEDRTNGHTITSYREQALMAAINPAPKGAGKGTPKGKPKGKPQNKETAFAEIAEAVNGGNSNAD